MKERRSLLIPCLGTVIVCITVMLLMLHFRPEQALEGVSSTVLPPYMEWIGKILDGVLFYQLLWFIGDLTEGIFFKDVLAAILMLTFVFAAWLLEKRGSKLAGTGVGGQKDFFGWILSAQFLGIALTQLFWGRCLASVAWIPTFVPMCSTAPPLVIAHEKNWKSLLTAGVLSALIPFPLAYGLYIYVTTPLGLPVFCAMGLGMGLGTLIATELCRLLPWMKREKPAAPPQSEQPAPSPKTDRQIYFRRLFADGTEMLFWGSDLAGAGMYLGVLLSWFIAPEHGSYGSGTAPVMLCVQLCTLAVSIFLWIPKYRKDGFALTFASILVPCAVAGTYPAHLLILVPTILFSAWVSPLIVEWTLKHIRVFQRWHLCVALQFSIGILCILWSFLVKYILMPFVL